MNILDKIKNLLSYTITSGKAYNGKAHEGGYHTLNILGTTINGQRIPSYRFEGIDYDFSNKVVLDIGSNQGGMLYEIQDKIKQGVGVDYDHRLVNVANRISGAHNYNNLKFYVFDLSKEDFNLLNNFVDNKLNVVFLLSVCMWIKNWKELVTWVSQNADHCLFETNGKKEQQQEQIDFLKTVFREVKITHKTSEDDPGQKKRMTVWCSK